jgi:hypothetical protein
MAEAAAGVTRRTMPRLTASRRRAMSPSTWASLASAAARLTLTQKITHLEQQSADLRLQLEERDDDLAAARAANRELMAQLNTAAGHR